jgi:hypothetical protein
MLLVAEEEDIISSYSEEEDYSPSSSAFESCTSDLTDDSTVVSTTSSTNIKQDHLEDYLIFPPITLSFHESLSFDMLRLYQVKCFIYIYITICH